MSEHSRKRAPRIKAHPQRDTRVCVRELLALDPERSAVSIAQALDVSPQRVRKIIGEEYVTVRRVRTVAN